MNPVEAVNHISAYHHRPLRTEAQPVHHKPNPRPTEPGSGFSLLLSQQVAEPPLESTEPPTEEPPEPPIDLKPRKSRKQLQRQNRPADFQPAGKQRNN
jgi:hypothetical protein